MGLLDVLFRKKEKRETPSQPAVLTEKMMTSQLPALYLQENQTVYRNHYIISDGWKALASKREMQKRCLILNVK